MQRNRGGFQLGAVFFESSDYFIRRSFLFITFSFFSRSLSLSVGANTWKEYFARLLPLISIFACITPVTGVFLTFALWLVYVSVCVCVSVCLMNYVVGT